jgi:hypothetical protein
VTAAEVGAAVHVAGDRLVARRDRERVQVIDPTTLAVTEIAATDVPVPDDLLAVAGTVAWTFEIDAGVLTAVWRDRSTTAELGRASIATPSGDRAAAWRGFTIGDDLTIVGTARGRPDAAPATWIFRAALRQVG